MEKIQKILEKINGKGWNLYYRGKPDEKIGLPETYQLGPAKILEKGISYIILPRVEKPTDQTMIESFKAKHQILPKISLPRKGFPYSLGTKILGSEGGPQEEIDLRPGEEIFFIGIELQNEAIRLITQQKTFIPYDVFLEALNALQDITSLTAV
ncbi:MAG: hypothetical protein Q8N22_01515 [bacterium]|nr:hypothetical protein [bacterium]